MRKSGGERRHADKICISNGSGEGFCGVGFRSEVDDADGVASFSQNAGEVEKAEGRGESSACAFALMDEEGDEAGIE